MFWHVRGRRLELGRQARIMGVLNVTPDSFSDGGLYVQLEAALVHAQAMAEEGAAIIDVGGESSRPGSDPIPFEVEVQRVVPVISALRKRLPEILISVDTYKAQTAYRALAAGADIVNDISAGGDPGMVAVIREFNAGIILMHMRGIPKTMQLCPDYRDVVGEVAEFLEACRDSLVAQGIAREQIALDPGFGFGKRLQDNIVLAGNLKQLAKLGRPIVVGLSRKSSLAQLLGDPKLSYDGRFWATVAFTSYLREQGAHIVRVHHVRPNLEAVRMTDAILSNE